MMKSKMTMIYIDSDNQARKTGIGAIMGSNAQTWKAFRSAKQIAVPIKKATFLLDYYNRNGELADSIPLSIKGFELITNEKAKSDKEYRDFDFQYWQKAMADLREIEAKRGKQSKANTAKAGNTTVERRIVQQRDPASS